MNIAQIAIITSCAVCLTHSTIEAADTRNVWWGRVGYIFFGGCSLYSIIWILINHAKIGG